MEQKNAVSPRQGGEVAGAPQAPQSSDWSPEELSFVAERAYLLHRQGRNREALTLFQGLRALEPNNLYFQLSTATLYLLTGGEDQAVEILNGVLAEHPEHLQALQLRCEALLRLAHLEEARRDLQQAQRLHPRHPFQTRLRVLIEALTLDRSRLLFLRRSRGGVKEGSPSPWDESPG